jgi:hypothetical protein
MALPYFVFGGHPVIFYPLTPLVKLVSIDKIMHSPLSWKEGIEYSQLNKAFLMNLQNPITAENNWHNLPGFPSFFERGKRYSSN